MTFSIGFGSRSRALAAATLAIALSACSSSNSGSSGSGGAPAGSGGAGGWGGANGSGGAPGSGGSPATGTGGSGTGGTGTGTGGASGGTTGGGTGGRGGAGTGGAGGNRDGGAVDAPATDGGAVDVVVRDGSTNDAGAFVRTGWTAVAMPDHVPANQTNPPSTESLVTTNAFDGNLTTRWATGVFQDTLTFPLFYTVNMQQAMRIGRITLYAGSADAADYPVSLDVAVSTDGTNFTPVVTGHRPAPLADNPRGAAIDTITIAPAVVAQWIQLKATVSQPTTNRRWWAIGELNVYP